MPYVGPELDLTAPASTTRTAATVAAETITTRMASALQNLYNAWSAARVTMWQTSTTPQDVADALSGDETYALEWFTLFDDLQAVLNDYMDDLPEFVHPDYVVTADTDSSSDTVGSVTISGTLDASAE